jgi:glucose dehydrogenase
VQHLYYCCNNTACPRRVYTNTPDGRLIAVNADNGQRCEDFGVNGTVDLLEGLGGGLKLHVLKSLLHQLLQVQLLWWVAVLPITLQQICRVV